MPDRSAEVAFALPPEVAQKVVGLFQSGRSARIVLVCRNRKVIGVEIHDVLMDHGDGMSSQPRTFYPAAIMLACG